MAGSIRICLIADTFIEDFSKCISSIRSHCDSPISIFASGKGLSSYQERFEQETVIYQKNKLGWGHSVNYLLNNSSEKYLVIMDSSTIFTSDAISPTLEKLEQGYQAVGWRGGLVNIEDQWRSIDDKGVGEVDVLFSYFLALDRQFAISAGGANPSATYYRNADIELSLALRAAGAKLYQIDLDLRQERHHGYHDVDPDFREKKSKENYNRILEKYRGRSDILSARR
ncbi:MAG: glycosyltransferase family 2 protein [Actinobacteria bacterium]|nr:glycosyltransferase family 2 protein [Actinomycetota bacterium]